MEKERRNQQKRRGDFYMSEKPIEDNCGLLSLIHRAIIKTVNAKFPDLRKDALPNPIDYFMAFEDEHATEFPKFDFVRYLKNYGIPQLDNTIKANIVRQLDLYEGWLGWLADLDLIMCKYWIEEQETTSEFKLIEEYYLFIRSQIEARRLPIPQNYIEHPIVKCERKNVEMPQTPEEEKASRTCIYCGSHSVINHSPSRYLCNICGRTFSKKKHKKTAS